MLKDYQLIYKCTSWGPDQFRVIWNPYNTNLSEFLIGHRNNHIVNCWTEYFHFGPTDLEE